MDTEKRDTEINDNLENDINNLENDLDDRQKDLDDLETKIEKNDNENDNNDNENDNNDNDFMSKIRAEAKKLGISTKEFMQLMSEKIDKKDDKPIELSDLEIAQNRLKKHMSEIDKIKVKLIDVIEMIADGNSMLSVDVLHDLKDGYVDEISKMNDKSKSLDFDIFDVKINGKDWKIVDDHNVNKLMNLHKVDKFDIIFSRNRDENNDIINTVSVNRKNIKSTKSTKSTKSSGGKTPAKWKIVPSVASLNGDGINVKTFLKRFDIDYDTCDDPTIVAKALNAEYDRHVTVEIAENWLKWNRDQS